MPALTKALIWLSVSGWTHAARIKWCAALWCFPMVPGNQYESWPLPREKRKRRHVEAGADYAGGDDLITKIKGGWLEFDKTVATPDMMGSVGKIGKILGPRGLMPNAKLGTVTFDLGKVIKEIKAGKIDFRVEKSGIVHAPVGRVSFGADRILENICHIHGYHRALKPAASKGTYIRSVAVSTTMGPGSKIDPANVKALLT